ncbi:DUF2147 domain-containing protein [Seonamhaeicola marinus]|uniref:DUF5640 domain-containing protein n=1 Tax=Seonamhaeicola marinus TaxID=1912246 RepID=A0A5D0HSN8_9FLAO|nr:hypothetical protein [Seonamhaeicola marinus]TYA74275.1 hypothetical protein FUA24_13165 [Seonamhaeicola marinus]
MKKIILLLIAGLTLVSFTSTKTTDFSIVGKWKGEDQKEVGYFIFQEDGYAFMEVRGMKLGGKDFEVKGKKGSMSYTIDYNTTPIPLDLIITLTEENESRSQKFIIEFIDNNTIKMAMGTPDTRPTSFEDVDSLVFHRVED